MTRRITITIEDTTAPGRSATATVDSHSTTCGPGAIADQIADLAGRVTAMWSAIEPGSTKPKAVPDAR